jgi:hypothetical protein
MSEQSIKLGLIVAVQLLRLKGRQYGKIADYLTVLLFASLDYQIGRSEVDS